MSNSLDRCEILATKIRTHALEMTHKAQSSHIGSCLSIADILAVLYGKVLNVRPEQPDWEGRDRFILSKGHACAILYAVLAECGFFPVKMLDTFYQNGSLLLGHINHYVKGIEASTGSLGHGLSIGCGMALAIKQKVYVLLSDGDCNEGSTWEAVMFASHHHLDNLIAIVDYNQSQALGRTRDILDLKPLAEKWESFGWQVQEIDGHDIYAIKKALLNCQDYTKPSCIIAHTIKGKGISFMENNIEFHYRYPNDEELRQALKELNEKSISQYAY